MALFDSSSPFMIITMSMAILVVFFIFIYGISNSFFFSVAPPFIEQAATYEFRNHINQPFYEQER